MSKTYAGRVLEEAPPIIDVLSSNDGESWCTIGTVGIQYSSSQEERKRINVSTARAAPGNPNPLHMAVYGNRHERFFPYAVTVLSKLYKASASL